LNVLGAENARVSFPWVRSTTKSQGGRPFSAQHTNAVRRPDSAARASEFGTVKRRTPKRTLTVSGPVAHLDRAPDYESGGREFESLRARQHLAPTYRTKNTAVLRNLQGTELVPILRLMHSCIGQWLAPGLATGMVAIDIVQELPNPYDRLKLEIVGSCFALGPRFWEFATTFTGVRVRRIGAFFEI
jgi:hypothetical protein